MNEIFEFVDDQLGIFSSAKYDLIQREIKESLYVQDQATKLLNFFIADILCMSQI